MFISSRDHWTPASSVHFSFISVDKATNSCQDVQLIATHFCFVQEQPTFSCQKLTSHSMRDQWGVSYCCAAGNLFNIQETEKSGDNSQVASRRRDSSDSSDLDPGNSLICSDAANLVGWLRRNPANFIYPHPKWEISSFPLVAKVERKHCFSPHPVLWEWRKINDLFSLCCITEVQSTTFVHAPTGQWRKTSSFSLPSASSWSWSH